LGLYFRVAFEKERNMSNPIIPFLIFFKSANVCTFLYKIALIESCAYFLIPLQTKSWSAKFPPKNTGITLLCPCSDGICQDPKGPWGGGGGGGGGDWIIIYLLGSVHRKEMANIKITDFMFS
jgi:hypothetical protein